MLAAPKPCCSAQSHISRHAAYCAACVVDAKSGTRRSKRMVSVGTMRLPERNLLQSADIVSESSYQLLIDGAWAPGSNGAYPIVNPATEQVVAEAPEASVADALAAAAAARAAQPKWAAVPAEEKARLLQAVADRVRAEADTLLPLIMAETGATVSVGSALQVPMVANRFERYAK